MPKKTPNIKISMVRLLLLLILTFNICGQVFSQEKKDLKISLATGLFNSKYYTNAKSRQFYNFSFEYSITNRHSLSSDYLSGQFRYYDSIRVTTPIPLSTPGYERHTNAEARSTFFSILYKYKIFDKRKLSVKVGTGITIITETYTFPVDLPNGGFIFQTSGGKGDLSFPLRFDFDYNISNHFEAGIIGGTYIYPDYPMVGQHLGFRLSYILK
jgi:hypothetical protein